MRNKLVGSSAVITTTKDSLEPFGIKTYGRQNHLSLLCVCVQASVRLSIVV